MEYYELSFKLKVPKPRWRWMRYRVRTLLMMMLLVAVGTTLWNIRAASREQPLMQKLQQSKADRDAALAQWKTAHSGARQGGATTAIKEVEARTKYFKHRAEVNELLQQIAVMSN